MQYINQNIFKIKSKHIQLKLKSKIILFVSRVHKSKFSYDKKIQT